MTALLSVEDLRITFPTRQGPSEVVGLTPPPGTATAKRLEFDGIDLRHATPAAWRALRGVRLSMVMQDPKFSLNPVMTIGRQLIEAARNTTSRAEAKDCAMAMLEAVQIRDPARVMAAYPHELSGGMGQRAMIAMMLITEPDLLIADEPTSALDVTVQIDVLRILDDLVSKRGMGLIFISHDLRLVASFCDRVLVMYAGRVVEELRASELSQAQHPYTQGLMNCLPRIEGNTHPLPTLQRDQAWAL
jgi:peptide/nickel transport system ATP-binding protein